MTKLNQKQYLGIAHSKDLLTLKFFIAKKAMKSTAERSLHPKDVSKSKIYSFDEVSVRSQNVQLDL